MEGGREGGSDEREGVMERVMEEEAEIKRECIVNSEVWTVMTIMCVSYDYHVTITCLSCVSLLVV